MDLRLKTYEKTDFTVLTYNKTENNFWIYTESTAHDEAVTEFEIDLTPYLGGENMDVISMIYPEVPLDGLEAALDAWEKMTRDLLDSHYYFSHSRDYWR